MGTDSFTPTIGKDFVSRMEQRHLHRIHLEGTTNSANKFQGKRFNGKEVSVPLTKVLSSPKTIPPCIK